MCGHHSTEAILNCLFGAVGVSGGQESDHHRGRALELLCPVQKFVHSWDKIRKTATFILNMSWTVLVFYMCIRVNFVTIFFTSGLETKKVIGKKNNNLLLV